MGQIKKLTHSQYQVSDSLLTPLPHREPGSCAKAGKLFSSKYPGVFRSQLFLYIQVRPS
jgi:hypothetical protein